jgi:dipeptidase D
MSEEDMKHLLLETRVFLERFGFIVKEENPYPSWKPFIGEFAKKVQSVSKKYFEKVEFYAIHAGLECGVILSKNPHLEAVSIGPNINYPHSTREEVEIDSIEKVLKLLEELL